MTKKSTKLLAALLVSSMLCATPSVAFAQDSSSMPTDETSIAGTLPSDLETSDETLPETTEPEVPEMEVSENESPLSVASESDWGGEWKSTNGRWWYQFSDGTYACNGKYEIDGVMYVFDAYGWMITGWYYNGAGWYYYDASGAEYYGWLALNGAWYYLDEEFGYMHTGYTRIGNDYYGFDASGKMVVGWLSQTYVDGDKVGTNWFYFDSDGRAHNGWLKSGGTWYYFEKGWMYSNELLWDDSINNVYGFNASGAMVSNNWCLIDGDWFYFDANGHGHNGWLYSSGTWYYFVNGWMYFNEILWDESINNIYGFNASGAMITNNWYRFGEEWCYFDANGHGHNGWLLNNGSWYYINRGWMLYGDVFEIDGKLCEFDENGIWLGYVEYN